VIPLEYGLTLRYIDGRLEGWREALTRAAGDKQTTAQAMFDTALECGADEETAALMTVRAFNIDGLDDDE
jgi:hypothetical protein